MRMGLRPTSLTNARASSGYGYFLARASRQAARALPWLNGSLLLIVLDFRAAPTRSGQDESGRLHYRGYLSNSKALARSRSSGCSRFTWAISTSRRFFLMAPVSISCQIFAALPSRLMFLTSSLISVAIILASVEEG